MQNVTRLCQTKNIVTVNGKFPGPRIIAREGDRLVIKVVNNVQHNVTIHWYVITITFTIWKLIHFLIIFTFLQNEFSKANIRRMVYTNNEFDISYGHSTN